jgi:hypothetical protein
MFGQSSRVRAGAPARRPSASKEISAALDGTEPESRFSTDVFQASGTPPLDPGRDK